MCFHKKYNALYNSVPSDNEEMMRIKHSIQKDLLKDNNTEDVVTVSEVVGATSTLQKNKSDGEAGLWSNHITYAPHRYRVHMSMLLTGLIVHGFNPRDLLIGTLFPLPKDIR